MWIGGGMGAAALLLLGAVVCWFELSRAGGVALTVLALFVVGGTAALVGQRAVNSAVELDRWQRFFMRLDSPRAEYDQRQAEYGASHRAVPFEMKRAAWAAAQARGDLFWQP